MKTQSGDPGCRAPCSSQPTAPPLTRHLAGLPAASPPHSTATPPALAPPQECVKASSGEDGKGPAPGEEKAWRKNLVRAMNHVAMRRVAAARRDRGDDDAGSVALGSDGIATALTRCERGRGPALSGLLFFGGLSLAKPHSLSGLKGNVK